MLLNYLKIEENDNIDNIDNNIYNNDYNNNINNLLTSSLSSASLTNPQHNKLNQRDILDSRDFKFHDGNNDDDNEISTSLQTIDTTTSSPSFSSASLLEETVQSTSTFSNNSNNNNQNSIKATSIVAIIISTMLVFIIITICILAFIFKKKRNHVKPFNNSNGDNTGGNLPVENINHQLKDENMVINSGGIEFPTPVYQISINENIVSLKKSNPHSNNNNSDDNYNNHTFLVGKKMFNRIYEKKSKRKNSDVSNFIAMDDININNKNFEENVNLNYIKNILTTIKGRKGSVIITENEDNAVEISPKYEYSGDEVVDEEGEEDRRIDVNDEDDDEKFNLPICEIDWIECVE